ncbi:unnamed protein product, partial [Prorocentrum cordatum]
MSVTEIFSLRGVRRSAINGEGSFDEEQCARLFGFSATLFERSLGATSRVGGAKSGGRSCRVGASRRTVAITASSSRFQQQLVAGASLAENVAWQISADPGWGWRGGGRVPFFDSPAVLAVYPGGGARFQVLCYLNEGWSAADGGALRLHPRGAAAVDVLPVAGRAALFLADALKHEVLPAARARYSCNVWYYDRAERDAALAEARATGQVGGGGALSVEDQRASHAFLQRLLGGGGPGHGELRQLAEAARRLPEGAARLVAQVLGVPAGAAHASAEGVASMVGSLTAESLGLL